MKVTIYGASDDLIEVEGDLREEFSYNEDDSEPMFVAVSDGTLMSIAYGVGGGFWRIHVLRRGTCDLTKFEATDDDGDAYSDRVTLDGDIDWISVGKAVRRKVPAPPAVTDDVCNTRSAK
jgi:hypothetical protein